MNLPDHRFTSSLVRTTENVVLIGSSSPALNRWSPKHQSDCLEGLHYDRHTTAGPVKEATFGAGRNVTGLLQVNAPENLKRKHATHRGYQEVSAKFPRFSPPDLHPSPSSPDCEAAAGMSQGQRTYEDTDIVKRLTLQAFATGLCPWCGKQENYANVEKLFYVHLLSAHPLKMYNDIRANIPQELLDKEYLAAASLNRGSSMKLGEERHLCNTCRKPAVMKCKYGGHCRRGKSCAFYHPNCKKADCMGPDSGCLFEHPHQNRTCMKCMHMRMQQAQHT